MKKLAKPRITTEDRPTLSPEAILVHTPHCTIRTQEEQYLIYNTKTDEMHLVSPSGMYVYELCDGLSSVHAIESAFCPTMQTVRSELHSGIMPFLQQLLDRGILEVETVS